MEFAYRYVVLTAAWIVAVLDSLVNAQYSTDNLQTLLDDVPLVRLSTSATEPPKPPISPLSLNVSAITEIRQSTISPLKHLQPDYPEYTHVNVSIWPMALARVDELQQRIFLKVEAWLTWYDRRLRWPATMMQKHNISLDALHREKDHWSLPFSELSAWTPRVLNLEAPSELQFIRVRGRYDGLMKMRGIFVEERTCQIHAKYFPFDRQCCPLTIATYSVAVLHAAEQTQEMLESQWQRVHGEKPRAGVPISYETGEWVMHEKREFLQHALNTNHSSEQFQSDFQMIQYELILTRRAMQHIFTWIAPPIVLSSSAVVGVFKGCDPSERLSFAASIMVTMYVMLDSLRAHLPVGTDGYPILGQLYLGLMLSLVWTILICNSPERLYPDRSRPFVNSKSRALLDKLALMATQNDKHIGRTASGGRFFKLMTQEKFRNWLMYGILTLQSLIVLAVVLQWMTHPLGTVSKWLGIKTAPEDFCVD